MFWSGTWSNAELLRVRRSSTTSPSRRCRRASAAPRSSTVSRTSSPRTRRTRPRPSAFQNYLAGKKAAQSSRPRSARRTPRSTDTQQAFVESAPWDLQIFLDEANDSSFPYPISKNTAAWNKLENDLLPAAFDGERPVAEVAKELAEKMNAALAKE